jgi:hypothetical protein
MLNKKGCGYMITSDKRKKMEKLIDDVVSTIDPSGVNAKKYRNMFQTMDDKQFDEYFQKLFGDKKSNLRIDIEEFGPENRKIKFENVEKAADLLHLKLFEYIYMPHISSDPNRPIRSRTPVLVAYLNIKRPQQLVTKKQGLILSDSDVDEMTGEAKGDSKGGTMTGMENELLAGVGAKEILSEFTGARGDNVNEYQNMVEEISEKGSVKLENIKTGILDKPTLLQADLFFAAMGLKTDLISESYYAINKIREMMNKNRN